MIEIIIFIGLTTLFFIGRFFIQRPSYMRIITGIYITLVLLSSMYFNMTLLSRVCPGNSGVWAGIKSTIIPWILIFGTVIVLLNIFPSWKRPFSNTFGYGVAKLAGVNSLLFKLLKAPTGSGVGTGSGAGAGAGSGVAKTIHNIYSNPSLFINEITPANFDDFVKNSAFMFVPGAAQLPEMGKLRNIIRMKELVAEYLWYILSGILVTTVSYNNVVNADCTASVTEMKKRHNEYEKDVAKAREEAKTAPPERVYYIRD